MACTIRVLELDGGGERGYMSTIWLKLFIQQWGITPNTLWQHFDVICGSSIGGIAALSYAFGLAPDVLENFFTTVGPYVFTVRNNPLTCTFGGISGNVPSNTPNSAQKLAFILLNDPFYASGSDGSNTCVTYGSELLYATLINTFGADKTMQDLKTNVLIPAYNLLPTTDSPEAGQGVLFSNIDNSNVTGKDELIINVAKATSAAPIYLPPATFGGKTYLDGGVYNNNPAQLGLDLAKNLKPTANRFCLLSIGTGIGQMQFFPDGSITEDLAPGFETIQLLFGLFNVASTGSQESTAKGLLMQSQNPLGNFYYYRFQPTLDPNLDTTLDNTKPEILEYYRTTATNAFNSDISNITTFIGHLTA